jgi:hypothetical protein
MLGPDRETAVKSLFCQTAEEASFARYMKKNTFTNKMFAVTFTVHE